MRCSHVSYTPYSGKRCWWGQSRLLSGMSITRRGFYAAIKLIFIHSSTNSIQRQRKNFFMHLDNWLYASNRPSRAMIQILNLWIFIFFQKIFKVDLESCTKMSGVRWWKPFLNRMLCLRVITKKMEEIRLDERQSPCVSMCQPASAAVRWNIRARGVVFMRQCTDFNSLNH
jgi:hypothetical protein